jgi:hypothetical protein
MPTIWIICAAIPGLDSFGESVDDLAQVCTTICYFLRNNKPRFAVPGFGRSMLAIGSVSSSRIIVRHSSTFSSSPYETSNPIAAPIGIDNVTSMSELTSSVVETSP